MKQTKKYLFIAFIGFVSILKIVLVCNLPVNVRSGPMDDGLMMNMTVSLLKGQWLGHYSQITLVKGIFYPLFLVATKLLSFPYLLSLTLFYLLGCLVFVYAVKECFPNRIILAVLFTFLLFNPVSYSLETFQRVYRSSIVPAQVLICFGAMFGFYLRREQPAKILLPWLIIAGFALSSLWLTREDSIWILPFMIVCLCVSFILFFRGYLIRKQKSDLLKAMVTPLPLVILGCCLLLVSTINNVKYGEFTANELTGSSFTKALQGIYSVVPSEAIDNTSVPRSTVEKLYSVSPTLNSIKPQLDASLDRWELYGKKSGDGQVEDGWFFWALRDAVADAGYYKNPKTANEFYTHFYSELKSAFEQGKLQKRATMPSPLMSPWRAEYAGKLAQTLPRALIDVVTYQDVLPQLANSNPAPAYTALVEFVVNGHSISASSDDMIVHTADKIVRIDSTLARVYQKTGVPLFIVGILCYLWITIVALQCKKGTQIRSIWLMLTSLILSALVVLLGVAYTDVSAYSALLPVYLTPAYPLVALFSGISILTVVCILFKLEKRG